MIVVIEPADGIPAAPIAIAVAVRLDQKHKIFIRMYKVHLICSGAVAQLPEYHISTKYKITSSKCRFSSKSSSTIHARHTHAARV